MKILTSLMQKKKDDDRYYMVQRREHGKGYTDDNLLADPGQAIHYAKLLYIGSNSIVAVRVLDMELMAVIYEIQFPQEVEL